MFSSTERLPQNPFSWRSSGTQPTPASRARSVRAATRRTPSTDIVPAEGFRCPAMARANSDFPDPASPARPTRSLARTERDTSWTERSTLTSLYFEDGRPLTVGRPARRVAGHMARPGVGLPDHGRHDGVLVEVLDRRLGHEATIAHHRHPLADLVDLLQVVGDEQERDPPKASRRPMWSKSCLISRDSRRAVELVENDEPAALAKRACDLEPLALADGEFARHLVDVDTEPQASSSCRPSRRSSAQLIAPARKVG